jgi:hypothetical protein
MKMEKWDLYNAKREKSGITVCRGEIIPKGLYHLSVSVWIVNQQGQYLCRSANRLKKRRAQRYQSLCIWRFFFVLFPAFRTPFCGEQDNFIHLPAGHAEKPLISVDF